MATTLILAHSIPTPTADAELSFSPLDYYAARRDGLLRELSVLERELGYGTSDRPTTAMLRKLWRKRVRVCPGCGVELR